jgi:membrane-bound serine protease (ClpP class)
MEANLLLGLSLIAGAVLLVIVEVFIPSGGLIAITAGVVAIAGVVILFMEDPVWGVIGMGLVVVLAPTAFIFAMKILPNTPVGRAMMGLPTPEEAEAKQREKERQRAERLALLGAEGEVVTALRPVGVIRIDGVRYDALAEGQFIEAGQKVRVTVIEDNQLKVRPIEEA